MPKRSTSPSPPRPRAGLNAGAAARVLAAIVAAAFAAPAQAQDAARGKTLYETHCLACHYERIHKRDPSRSLVRSMAQLRAEVARRAEQAGRRFSVEDADDIAEYLDQSHYRFAR